MIKMNKDINIKIAAKINANRPSIVSYQVNIVNCILSGKVAVKMYSGKFWGQCQSSSISAFFELNSFVPTRLVFHLQF